jgi:3D (Asp-Asp-Asp) domain-containing protein
MRILATLILAATVISVVPVSAAEISDIDQNAIQKLETKKADSLNDNFLIATYVPLVSLKDLKRIPKAKSYGNMPKGSFVINASAYTAAADECGKSDGITASGNKVKANQTLACPPNFSFGTKINIEGMGTYVCEDRGGAIKGNHVDIYMPTKKEAFSFGRRSLIASVVR